MRSYWIICLLIPLIVHAIPPGENGSDDDPFELSSRKLCFFNKKISYKQGQKIKQKALRGDSIAAMFLADNLGFVEGFENDSSKDWLDIAEENGNPFAYTYFAFEILRSKEKEQIPTAIKRLKIAAEKGVLGAISWLVTIYSGEEEGLEEYKNDSLANYWREREALSGNLFDLKKFVLNNPNQLSNNQLLPWQEAFEFINTKSIKRKVFPMSSDAKWLVDIFKRNKENITALLKQHDVVYSNYRHCKYNSLTRQKQ